MQGLFISLLLCLGLSAWARPVDKETFEKMSQEHKARLLKAYREFFKEYSQGETTELHDFSEAEVPQKSTWMESFRLIQEAHAAAAMKACFYAGWPSTSVALSDRQLCSTPLRAGSAYEAKYKDSCKKSELLCQPMLFGDNLCVPIATKEQRNSAFSQCQKLFDAAQRTVEDVVEQIQKNNKTDELIQLAETVNQVCSSGFQAKTRMCTNLKSHVQEIVTDMSTAVAKSSKTDEKQKPVTEVKKDVKRPVAAKNADYFKANPLPPEVLNPPTAKEILKIIQPTIPCEPSEANKAPEAPPVITVPVSPNDPDFNKTVVDQHGCRVLAHLLKPKLTAPLPKEEEAIPLNQAASTPDDYCARDDYHERLPQTRQDTRFNDVSNKISYDVKYLLNNKTGVKEIESLRMQSALQTNSQMGNVVLSDTMDNGSLDCTNINRPFRTMELNFPGRGKEAIFEINDEPYTEEYKNGVVVSRGLAPNIINTQYTFFPRKVVPAMKVKNDRVAWTLPTGEEIEMDRVTGAMVGGAAIDAPTPYATSTGKNGKKYFYPEKMFSYQGQGIYIESHVTIANNGDREEPNAMVSVKSVVDGQKYECKVRSEDIWSNSTSFGKTCSRVKFEKDEDFYKYVQNKCPNFRFPSLIKF